MRVVGQRTDVTLMLPMLDQRLGDQAHCTQRDAFAGQALEHGGKPRQWHGPLQLLHQLWLTCFEPTENRLAFLKPQELRARGEHGAAHPLHQQLGSRHRLHAFVRQQRIVRRQP